MDDKKKLPARFFETDKGNIPVREWLLSLSPEDRKLIGDDIRTADDAESVHTLDLKDLTPFS